MLVSPRLTNIFPNRPNVLTPHTQSPSHCQPDRPKGSMRRHYIRLRRTRHGEGQEEREAERPARRGARSVRGQRRQPTVAGPTYPSIKLLHTHGINHEPFSRTRPGPTGMNMLRLEEMAEFAVMREALGCVGSLAFRYRRRQRNGRRRASGCGSIGRSQRRDPETREAARTNGYWSRNRRPPDLAALSSSSRMSLAARLSAVVMISVAERRTGQPSILRSVQNRFMPFR